MINFESCLVSKVITCVKFESEHLDYFSFTLNTMILNVWIKSDGLVEINRITSTILNTTRRDLIAPNQLEAGYEKMK